MSDLVPQSVPSGTILMFAGVTVPAGYLWCNGQSLLRAEYPALFAAIGTCWGTQTAAHFNLPPSQGIFFRGLDTGSGLDTDRAGRIAIAPGGNSSNTVGSFQGHSFQQHFHPQTVTNGSGSSLASPQNSTYSTGSVTSALYTNSALATGPNSQNSTNETRPVNAYVVMMIKI